MAAYHPHDRISNLPEEIQDQILECLPTNDAAKTAVLSKHWNDVWLRHQLLVFDDDFVDNCVSDTEDNKRLALARIIRGILKRRTGSVKSFTLNISETEYMLKTKGLKKLCRRLSRKGVEELDLRFPDDYTHSWRLPVCLVSCNTIKNLKLTGLIVSFPVNISCIFPNVTKLFFESVEFNNDEIVSVIPNLETIYFFGCYGLDTFKIRAPKLETVIVLSTDQWKWVKLYWSTIKTLYLSPDLLMNSFCGECSLKLEMFPTTMNLNTLQLNDFCFGEGTHIALVMQLLKKSPNLCQLEIDATPSNKEARLEDSDGCCIDRDLEMLHTVKITSFRGTKVQMHFVKTLLSKSPALDKLTITKGWRINESKALKIKRELLSLPRASQKAQIDFIISYH